MTEDKRKRAQEIIDRYVKNGGVLLKPDDGQSLPPAPDAPAPAPVANPADTKGQAV
jgi:hypothetical protein